MKIGLLNELLDNISCCVKTSTSDKNIQSIENPVNGETVFVKWDVVRNSDVSLFFKLSDTAFVDRVEVAFGENTYLTAVTIMSEGQILSKHTAETGKTITDRTVTLEAGSFCDNLALVLSSDFSDVEVLSVKFYGAVKDERDIFPTPNKITFGGKKISAEVFSGVCADDDKAKNAAKILAEKYEEITGVKMSENADGAIEFVPDLSVKAEGCRVEVSENRAIIKASDERGFVMGAETFIKLCDKDGVTSACIDDAPAYEFRGVHLFMPSRDSIEFAKRFIKYVVSPLGYNSVIIEIAGGMEFESHPEINEAVVNANKMAKEGKWPPFPHGGVAGGSFLTKDEVRDFVAYIRFFGIDVVPEIQSLGHVQFMTQAHPDIAEIDADAEKKRIDTRAEDARPNEFYYHSYCPSNPKSYDILFDLMEEIIEVFRPRKYVHMGHDEVYQIGVCPVCKTKDPAQLYYDDIMKIHGFLEKKGLKMMIWSDMIQPVSHYLTRPAIDMLPKDILMLDFIWYFHLDKDIEDNLLSKGYKVAVGNLYSSHYPRYESRIRKDGMVGGQISSWVETNENSIQCEGKFYDHYLTAEMLWSDSYSKNYTLCYDRMIKALMPKLRENLKGIKYPSLQDGAVLETIAQHDIDFPPREAADINADITVDGEYRSLIFCHTELKKLTRLPWQKHDVTGKYVLTYSDGLSQEVEITNNGNIGYWNRRQNEALLHPLYRHTGYTCTYFSDSDEYKTKDGENVCIYKYEHILPEGKKLVSVKLEQNEKFDTEIFLAKLIGVK